MHYPVTSALVDHFLAGLSEAETREIRIVDRLRAVIATLPVEAQRKLSITSVLANVATDTSIASAVRKLIANPAFKAEPIIAQLRRAEAAYIEAHDAYRADPASGLRLKEMEWAQVRHAIAARFYDEMVISLPPAKRPASERPMVRSRTAAIPLRLADFSADEQKALRQAAVDKDKAIALLEDIIGSNCASGDRVRVIHAYLVAPDGAAMFGRWLTDELVLVRSSVGEAEADASDISGDLKEMHLPADPAPIAVSGTPVHTDGETATIDPSMDAETRRDIATIEAFCRKQGWAITLRGEGRYGLKSNITKREIVSAFERVGDHPAMQDLLRMLAERTAAQVQSDKDAR